MRDVARLIGEERAALLGAIASVTAWDTPAARWTVKDTLAHLVQTELRFGRVYRGETRSLEPADPAEAIALWAPLPGEAVRGALWQHGVANQRVLESMTDGAWETPIEAPGCATPADLARVHLLELAVHAHDVTDAIGVEATWGPRLGAIAEAAAAALAGPAVRVTGDGFEVAGGDGTAGARVTMELGLFVLAATGRVRASEALDAAEVAGDRGAAERVLGAVAPA